MIGGKQIQYTGERPKYDNFVTHFGTIGRVLTDLLIKYFEGCRAILDTLRAILLKREFMKRSRTAPGRNFMLISS